MRRLTFVLAVLIGVPAAAAAQPAEVLPLSMTPAFLVAPMGVMQTTTTLDCDAPAPTTPATIMTGRPYTIGWCVPSTVVENGEAVPMRIDGFKAVLDTNPEVELGKLPLGTPSPTLKLQPVLYRTTSGVPKGNHQVVVTPWNYPLMADGVTPDTTKPIQRGQPVTIPFVGIDLVMTGAPPPIQKGRIIR